MSEVKRVSANWHMELFYESPQGTHVAAEDYEAALAREAALREELNGYEPASSGTASKRARWLLNIQDAIKYGLPKHLVGRLNNTAKEIQNSIKYGGTKRLRDENEALQQRLTDAEKRSAIMEKALTRIAREHDCGCWPCTGSCVSQTALEITVEAMREIASDALKPVEGEGS